MTCPICDHDIDDDIDIVPHLHAHRELARSKYRRGGAQ